MSAQEPKRGPSPMPGDGIRSARATNLFRIVNFELYARPNKVIMAIGLVGITGALGYIGYMRYKYAALQEHGTDGFTKKTSKLET